MCAFVWSGNDLPIGEDDLPTEELACFLLYLVRFVATCALPAAAQSNDYIVSFQQGTPAPREPQRPDVMERRCVTTTASSMPSLSPSRTRTLFVRCHGKPVFKASFRTIRSLPASRRMRHRASENAKGKPGGGGYPIASTSSPHK